MAQAKVFQVLNEAQLFWLLNSEQGPVAKDLVKRGVKVQSQARRNLGGSGGSGPKRIDTGLLRASVSTQLGYRATELAIRVGTNVYYARWVHDGTGIYGPRGMPIRPRTAPFLVFRWKKMNNKLMVVKSVKGMKPNPFLKDALKAAGPGVS